jgi:hypothetical protein
MGKHGNSNDNDALHHLYEIWDREYKDVYKYGICGEELLENNISPRGKLQVKELNRAVRWLRFYTKTILVDIKGRIEAKRLEDEYIENFTQKYGYCPFGNDTEDDWDK